MSEFIRNLDRYNELNNSFRLDVGRSLEGDCGLALLGHILDLMAAREQRQRALRQDHAASRANTVSIMLANLVAAALNQIDDQRYVAMGFARQDFVDTPMSYQAAILARETLIGSGLVEFERGYHVRHHIDFLERGAVSRLRATSALHDLIDRFAIRPSSLAQVVPSVVVLKTPEPDAGDEPKEIAASRAILESINARLTQCQIDLPEESWARIRRRRIANAGEKVVHIPSSGDQSSKSLYRVFNCRWDRGGRLHGGWWQQVESAERRHITIEGEPTIEADFGTLHPAILYRALGLKLDVKPYDLPPYSRELCKETFQRLINRGPNRGGDNLRRVGKNPLPSRVAFATFIGDYKRHLAPVAHCFGKDIGLLLQREDSELALRVLDGLERQNISALPIHDSFIVQRRHRVQLIEVMERAYRERYSIDPVLKVVGG